ncbi:MAG: TolC family protein, partial [Pseudomonadota bacterium]
ANSRSVLIAKKRYHAGISNFLDTLDAERSLFEAQKQFAQAQAESAINYITLYKSLGGGWKEKNAVTK